MRSSSLQVTLQAVTCWGDPQAPPLISPSSFLVVLFFYSFFVFLFSLRVNSAFLIP